MKTIVRAPQIGGYYYDLPEHLQDTAIGGLPCVCNYLSLARPYTPWEVLGPPGIRREARWTLNNTNEKKQTSMVDVEREL